MATLMKTQLIDLENDISINSVFSIVANGSMFDPENTQTYTVMSSNDFAKYIVANYGDRYISHYAGQSASSVIAAEWAAWNNSGTAAALYALLHEQYNPIENYNRTETHYDGKHTDAKTIQRDAWTASSSAAGYVTAGSTITEITTVTSESGGTARLSTPLPADNLTYPDTLESSSTPGDRKHYTTTNDNAETGRLEYYDTVDRTDGVADTSKTDNKPSVAGSKTIGQGEEYTMTHQQLAADASHTNASGNIGVTTTQQMISSELELRLKSWVCDFIDAFINRYTFYSMGVDFDD